MALSCRISVIGGGSAYTPGLVEGLLRRSDELRIERLVLMDIDGPKLATVGNFVRALVAARSPATVVHLTTERHEAIVGMDFIISQIRVGGLEARHIDESVPVKYGVIGQETTGPGGFAMAIRTIPVMVDIARDIERLNPNAWLLNYTNPTGLVAEALHRTSSVKLVSLCDEPMVLRQSLALFLGVPWKEVHLEYFGLNHLGWVRKVRVRGKDVMPELRESVRRMSFGEVESAFKSLAQDSKTRAELRNTVRILLTSGMLPNPYLQYYYFTDEILTEQQQTKTTRAQEVMAMEKDLLAAYAGGQTPASEAKLSRGGPYHADALVGVLVSIASDNHELHIANVPNQGAIHDLPCDKVVEVTSIVDALGAHPLVMGKLPLLTRGLIQAVAAYEQLTVEAALEGSYEKALEALSSHPLVRSTEKAKGILDEYLVAHGQYLSYFKARSKNGWR